MVAYIYYTMTAAGNSVSSQLGSSYQGNRYGKEKAGGTYKITPACSLSSSQPGGPPCWASPLDFGPIGFNIEKYTVSRLFLYCVSTIFVLCFNYVCTAFQLFLGFAFNCFCTLFQQFMYYVQHLLYCVSTIV
jgi:hypothetical protein